MSDFAFASAADLAALVATRAVSPVELVEDALARIEQSQSTLNAFITICAEQARGGERALQLGPVLFVQLERRADAQPERCPCQQQIAADHRGG